MRIRRHHFVAAAVVALASAVQADVYSDGNLTVNWQRTGDDYAGTFVLNGQSYAAKGHAAGGEVRGTFAVGGTDFAFTGTLAGDTLTLQSGVKTYTLRRTDSPNPLDTGNAAAPAVGGVAAPAGYTTAAADDKGVALKTTKPDVRSVQDALSLAAADVGGLFDAKPTVAGAVEDQRDHKSGAAVVTGQRGGRATRGVISCRLTDAGAVVNVVLADTDAPAEVWQKLSAPQNAVAEAAAKVPLREYRMLDGTGSIGLPDGWTTQAASMLDPIFVKGPNDASVTINGSFIVNPPHGQLMQIYQQTLQMAQHVGMAPPPPPPGLFADFSLPSDAVKTLLPQLNRIARQINMPTVEPGAMQSILPAPSQLPNGRGQFIEDTATWVKPDGTRTLMHGVGRYESAQFQGGDGTWMMQVTNMVAPDADFARTQPVMAAIMNSGKINQEQFNRVSRQRQEQMQAQLRQSAADGRARLNAQFEAGQAAHREQMASYDRYNHNWAVNENMKDRSNDNFCEYLRGTRDIVDTQTGGRTTVDLNSAGGIVDSLNQNDPGRYGQVPLRDDLHPLIR